ncbi:hypothetical protein D3C85_1548320 [compost metagenome]
MVRFHRVDGQRDGLDPTLGKFVFQLRRKAQLGGAHRREVGRVGEQHTPAIAQPLVELDSTSAGVLFEIGGDIAESEAHGAVPCECLMGSTVPVFFIC